MEGRERTWEEGKPRGRKGRLSCAGSDETLSGSSSSPVRPTLLELRCPPYLSRQPAPPHTAHPNLQDDESLSAPGWGDNTRPPNQLALAAGRG